VVHVTRRRVAALGALALASAFCVALLEVRMHVSGTRHHDYLLWNLVLAWLPFLFALALYDADRRRTGTRIGRLVLGALWLLFFPNAPYLVTDLIHLNANADVGIPQWYDVILLSMFAWTGLALGIGSLLLVHHVARRRIGEWTAWAALVPTLALVSFGIYLGRFVRLNSWDPISRPGRVVHAAWEPLRDPLGHPKAVAVTVLFTVFLMVTYLVVYTVAELRVDPEEGATRHRRRV
jgi:uncharacterized membrane protein